jgi:lysozyme family protein
MNVDMAFDRLMLHEGGLSMNPKDPGNWTGGAIGVGVLKGTKYGISSATYPRENIAGLTVKRAKFLWSRDFWTKIHGDKLYDGVAYQLSDFAYHSGYGNAIRVFQKALGVSDDGIWGPISQAAADTMLEHRQIMRLNAKRLDWLTYRSNWVDASKGWARRIAGNLMYGAEDS